MFKAPQEILMLTPIWGQGVIMQGEALLEYQIWTERLRRWGGGVRDPWLWPPASQPSPRELHTWNNTFTARKFLVKIYTNITPQQSHSSLFPQDAWKQMSTQRLVNESSICNNQNLETILMSTNRWLDKHIVIYLHNAVLLSSEKEGTVHICNNIDGSQKKVNERSQTKKTSKKERVHNVHDSIHMKF